MDPGTGAIIAATIAAAAQGGMGAIQGAQAKASAKRRAKEMKRETFGNLLSDAMQRNAELEGQRMQSGSKLGKRKSQSMMDTATLLREAFGI